jgi:hypothetical protein
MMNELTARLGCRDVCIIRRRWPGLPAGMGRALAAAELLLEPALSAGLVAMPFRESGDLLTALTLSSRLDVDLCLIGPVAPDLNLRFLFASTHADQRAEGAALARTLAPFGPNEEHDAAVCLGGLLGLQAALRGRSLWLLL